MTDRAVSALRSLIAEELQCIGKSNDIGLTERLRQLLGYLVREELAGRGERLKAFAIATEALGRSTDFDPALDSIVRVEMARLRTALKLYYAANPDAAVLIEIPKGQSRPRITSQKAPLEEQDAVAHTMKATAGEVASRAASRFKQHAIAGLVAVAGAAVVLLALSIGTMRDMMRPTGKGPLPPLVLVSSISIASTDTALKALELGLKAEIVAALSTYSWLAVAHRSEVELPTAEIVKTRSVYTLRVNVAIEGSQYDAIATLQEAPTGRVRWSSKENGDLSDDRRFSTLAIVARRIAADIGQPMGVVTQTEIASQAEQKGGAYSCLLKLRTFGMDWRKSSLIGFRQCASGIASKKEIPSDLEMALEARLLVLESRMHRDTGTEAQLAKAEAMLGRALGARSTNQLILSTELQMAACRQDRERYERAREETLRRRGNDPYALHEVAYHDLFSFGDMSRSLNLSQRADSLALEPQPMSAVVPGFLSLRVGDFTGARGRLTRSPVTEFPIALLLLAIAQAEADQVEGTARTLTRLRNVGFTTNAELAALVESECWSKDVRDRFRQGLKRVLALS